MSMTQVAFLKKADLITKAEIENYITVLGYDISLLDDFDKFYDVQGGLPCKINGHEGFFEIYSSEISEIVGEFDWIAPDISNQDLAITFSWGADYAAGSCIGLISVALIDKSNALVYYLDDEMKYTREMLLADTPLFLKELEKQNPAK